MSNLEIPTFIREQLAIAGSEGAGSLISVVKTGPPDTTRSKSVAANLACRHCIVHSAASSLNNLGGRKRLISLSEDPMDVCSRSLQSMQRSSSPSKSQGKSKSFDDNLEESEKEEYTARWIC